MPVVVNKADLQFILKQIKIAEAHAAGGNLADLVAEAGGFDPDASAPSQAALLPYGLRTVDGSYNNLLPGRELWGAADQPFVELLQPQFLNLEPGTDLADGDSLAFSPVMVYTNNNYGLPASTLVNGAPGNVVIDAAPRIISNLIVDQSAANPAALAAMSGDAFAFDHDGNENTPDLIFLPNVAPDEGLSSPYNSWMTLFGQFFDHGLDLVSKGGNGTVYAPLMPDDPLYVEGSHTNFMALTRVSENEVNLTTPWIDQNQTYGSTASKQILMREYVVGPEGRPVSSGLLLEGEAGGLATWADVKQQARDMLGINLTDADVGKIPLIASDQYGNFIPGTNGYAQIVVGLGPDGILGTADDELIEGNPLSPISTAGAILTGHAFLDDIAHNAVPVITGGVLQPDSDSATANAVDVDVRGNNIEYDNELLDQHYITGDGRGNENIGLTAVHHVFHSEHNRIVEQVKETALASNDLAFLNEWLLVPVTEIPTTPAGQAALAWDGERLFQAGRFTTEMEYQHLVFEEFGRKMQPDIDVFVFEPSIDINPAIAAEFAHVVYRFGHSMLNEGIDRIHMVDGVPVQDNIRLIEGFLNPVVYADGATAEEAAGAIIRGMSRQVGNEIDEFVTSALRTNLLGLPLDLATINLLRGRDVGMPSLNAARTTFFEATGDTKLKPYESWVDFASNIKNPESVINFIAAYGQHETIAAETTIVGKRAAATALVTGQAQVIGADDPNTPDVDERGVFGSPQDRVAFLNSTGSWANRETGLNTIDFWIGGLAEKKMAFGGVLGSTFTFVFQMTMENLQDADRFYYLSRTQGLNMLNELENNTFSSLVMANTDLGDAGSTTLPGDLFSAVNIILEMDQSKQMGPDPTQSNPVLEALTPMVVRSYDYIRYNGNDHVVIGGTANADTIIAGGGDDSIWGRAGDDTIEAGYGVDKVHGGDGDDVITNSGTDIGETDFFHGGAGNDVIHGGSGLALIFGNEGSDFLMAGPDGKEVFGGTGTDFILGGSGGDFLLGNEGDDWLEGGARFDTLAGENSELFFNSRIIGHDVMNGGSGDTDYDAEAGDDIMFQAEGIQRSNGMAGFDWAIHKGDTQGANSDLGIPIFVNQEAFILRDRFDLVEGLSGWSFDDVLTGRGETIGAIGGNANFPALDAPLESYSNALLEAGVNRIGGLREMLSHLEWDVSNPEAIVMETADGADILLGGDGNDLITGKDGDDIIDGDAWLNVRISVRNKDNHDEELFSVDSLTEIQGRMFTREILTSQLEIIREIVMADGTGDIDTAVFSGNQDEYEITFNTDGSIRVAHDGGDGTDGTDTLRNIERFRFADGEITATAPPVVSAPVILAPSIEDMLYHITTEQLLENATDASGNPLSIQNLTADSGMLTVNPDGSWDYIPDLNADTDVSFSYVVSNGQGSTATSATLDLIGMIDISNTGTQTGNANAQQFHGTAGAVNQIVNAGGGNDIIFAGAGNDSDLNGMAGDDTFVAGDGDGNDNYDGGGGTDTYDLSRVTGDVVLHLGSGSSSGAAGDDEFVSIENVVGGRGNDNITGTGTANTLSGRFGNDILNGGGGNDNLDGGFGDDTIEGGAGNDAINVGSGNDVLRYVANFGADVITGFDAAGPATEQDLIDLSALGITAANLAARVIASTSGDNTVLTVRNAALAAIGTIQLNGVLNADIDVSDYILAVAPVLQNGTAGNDTLTGTPGNDTIDALAGHDTVNGLDGDDTLLGRGGRDTLQGGMGTNSMNGGASSDTASYADAAAGVTVSLAITGAQNTIGAGTDTLSNIENLLGSAFDDTLTGNAVVNLLTGGAGNDWLVATVDNVRDTLDGGADSDTADYGIYTSALTVDLGGVVPITVIGSGTEANTDVLEGIENFIGGSGHDFISGSSAANILEGGAGNDTINAGAGDDTVNGGAGGDTLIGGAGADELDSGAADDNVQDVFVFSAAADFGDTVINFDANGDAGLDDRIVFDGALAATWDDGFTNGNLLFTTGNGGAGEVIVRVGQSNPHSEALLLTGANGEGVTTVNLGNAAAVSMAINAEFDLTAVNGEDALLVINDTDANSFALWQWVQASGGETVAAELTLVGIFTSNDTVTADNFAFA